MYFLVIIEYHILDEIGGMDNILNITDNYIIILDKGFKIKFCNKKALLKIKYTLEDVENSKAEKVLDIKNLDINKLSKDSSIRFIDKYIFPIHIF